VLLDFSDMEPAEPLDDLVLERPLLDVLLEELLPDFSTVLDNPEALASLFDELDDFMPLPPLMLDSTVDEVPDTEPA